MTGHLTAHLTPHAAPPPDCVRHPHPGRPKHAPTTASTPSPAVEIVAGTDVGVVAAAVLALVLGATTLRRRTS